MFDTATLITFGFLTVIVLLFLFFVLKFELPVFWRAVRIRSLTKRIRYLNKDVSKDPEATRQSVYSLLKRSKFLGAPIEAFDREWRELYGEKVQSAIIPISFEDFVTVEDVLPRRLNPTLAGAIPGILVASGILGTFVGLVWTLPNLGISGSESQQILATLVQNITSGLGLAFWTSIAGIGLSIIYIFINRFALNRAEQAAHELFSAVSQVYPAVSESKRALVTHRQLEDIRDSVDTLAMDIASNLSTAIEPAFNKALGQHLAPAIEAIQKAVEQMADMASERQIEGVQKIVNSFVGSMNEALGDKFRELQEVLDAAVQSQRTIGGGLEEFSLQMKEASEAQRSLIQETTRAGETLKSSLDRLELISETLSSAAGKIIEAGSQLESSAAEANRAHEIARKAQEDLLLAAKSHGESMENARISIEKAWASATEQAKAAVHQIQEATRELGEGIGDQLVTALETFDGSLGETIERFSGTLSQIDGSISELPAAANQIRTSSEQLAQHTGAISAALQATSDVIVPLSSALSQFQSAVGALTENITPVERSLSQVARSLDGDSHLSRINTHFEESKSIFSELHNSVSGFPAQMEQVRSQLAQLIERGGTEAKQREGVERIVAQLEVLTRETRELQRILSAAEESKRKGFWSFRK